jgi:hypothetical protein
VDGSFTEPGASAREKSRGTRAAPGSSLTVGSWFQLSATPDNSFTGRITLAPATVIVALKGPLSGALALTSSAKALMLCQRVQRRPAGKGARPALGTERAPAVADGSHAPPRQTMRVSLSGCNFAP